MKGYLARGGTNIHKCMGNQIVTEIQTGMKHDTVHGLWWFYLW